ncbi:Sulfotransferase family protein [Roseivivax lentus]|uniref:Sulfotransferase family protein n=1 Tax=Roseivivax lentus TaxID=633194 RepID=A0A1N7Q567_9RHOB|nr:sulfotransferase [Roseivivax lentus]SIT18012.1 Sulfotransferase family protein [Roseivivax lentus]
MTAPALPLLPPVALPGGARMLFVIGAQKAGTTFLHRTLGQSPDLHLPPVKELHYFDIRGGMGKLSWQTRLTEMTRATEALAEAGPRPQVLARAQAAFDLLAMMGGAGTGPDRHAPYIDYITRGLDGQAVVADITPAYAILPARDYADMATIGQARFVFVLRDPVARMWSQIRMAAGVQMGPGASAETLFETATARARHLIETGRLPNIERADYARTLRALDRAVAPERLRVLFYEDMVRDVSVTASLCAFLGIAPVVPDLSARVNAGASLPLPEDLAEAFRAAFAPQYEAVRARFGDAVPASWRG